MIVTIRIPDEIYTEICERAPKAPNTEISKIVETHYKTPPTNREVVLNDTIRREIEVLYGRAIEDQEHFLRWVKDLAAASIGDVAIDLTSEQIRRLTAEAKFKNKDLKEHRVERIKGILKHGFGF
jgi:hypothetical protein